jgi:tetratricopeptide (TPR) repeat protein
MDQGKSLETMTQEDLLKDWASWETAYADRKYWLRALYEGLSGAAASRAAMKTIHEPLYHVLRKEGPDAVPGAYDKLKASPAGEYRLDERSLLSIAIVLQEDGKHRESIPFFELCIREFPASSNAEFQYESLGRAYLAVGDKARAIPSLRKVLELNPKNEDVSKLLTSLDAR